MNDRAQALTAGELLDRSRTLDDQIYRLVKTEQRLFRSQRDLSRQLDRFDALSRFATRRGPAHDRRALLTSAADLVFSIFPFDQCLAFVADEDGQLRTVASKAVPGRVADSAARFATMDPVVPIHEVDDVNPRMGPDARVRASDGEISQLLDVLDRVFHSPDDPPLAEMPTMVLPIAEASAIPIGFLAFRRLDSVISYHDELPTARDLPFLQVLSQQVATALIEARLVANLKLSYEKLAKAQHDLVLRERLAALGELAAVVAHEVRNPLAVIFNALSSLTRVVPSDGPASTLVGILDEEAHRLNHIVDDLIDFARPHAPRMAPELLEDVVREAVESARAAFNDGPLAVLVESRGTVPPVNCDSRMLRQILVNLILNARQATVHAEPIVVTLSAREADPFVTLEVTDRGSGIAPGDLERIFEPFYTTKATGTGLGLAVVRRFAELHGGTVSVRSTLGEGSTFTVRLPAA